MEQTTQNTPAEVVYQPEAELPPITSLDDLSHIRAIDKQGRSVTMTPAQLRELTGIDYSKLEEQIVPGESWYSADGTRKQIYTQTFRGTLPPINYGDKGILLRFGYASSIFYHSAFYRTPNDVKIPISIYNDNNWLNTAIIEFSTVAEAQANVGSLYVATIKYIK